MIDPIEALARHDKWYLGCGDGTIFAPPFPAWLDAPGFWDDATIFQYGVGPLYTVTFLDHNGRELPLACRERRWTPAELTVEYDLPNGMTATEVRSVHPGGVFASEWLLRAPEPATLHAVAWTVQDTSTVVLPSVQWDGALQLTRTLRDRRDLPLDVRMELAAVGEATSWSASLSERSALQPHWRFTPFGELWRGESLPRVVRMQGISPAGFLYGAVHTALPAGRLEMSVAFAMRVTAAEDTLRAGRTPTPLGASVVRRTRKPSPTPIGVGVAEAPHSASMPLARASRRRWRDFFARVPHFTCTDPYLERYYWYRWYGLFLNSIQPGTGHYQWPTVCEGIGFFHEPITYSAQCHVRELRWLGDPAHARGVLRTIFEHQKPDGSLHGRVYVNHLEGTDFYHANWGDALLALDALHPDDAFVAEMLPAMARHAEWLLRTRDADGTGMIDVVDQFETGQEYMSRYQAVDPNADTYGWENRIRLKGIDVTVYAYALFRALARLTLRCGRDTEATLWDVYASRTAQAVRERMWDAESQMFSDVNPASGQRTGVAAAVCFYPYFTDLATEEHLAGLERHLLDPQRFWTSFPAPSSALDDPLFSAVAEWKGKRHVCPWNGRVWPMTNSHLMEALGRWGTAERPRLRQAAGHFLQRFVRMMFHEGDVDRPNCFEHYNPLTGAASVYRGIDDYQHSWVADLILQYACGVRVLDDAIVIDPLPMQLEAFEVRGLRVRGVDLSVRLDSGYVTVTANEQLHMAPLGEPITLPL
ncbi:MAG: trehalase family glycosidase [Gemmatimonadaceae bacterium]